MSEEKNKNDYEMEDEFDDSEEFSFWSFRTIFTLFLMVLLIGAGIYSFNKKPEESIDDKVANLEEKSEEAKSEEESKSEEVKSEENKEETKSEEESKSEEVKSEENKAVEEVKSNGEKVSVVVQCGEGVTNLARKSIADYISKNNIELSVEQKLFAETHIKDLYKSKYKGLNTGDTVEFDSADLVNTVTEAKNLSESQIKAWSKYVSLVPSLK